MSNVVILDLVTRLDVPADRVLEAAIGQLTEVVITGFDKEGNEYFASSVADGGSTLWHLERAKYKLLRLADED